VRQVHLAEQDRVATAPAEEGPQLLEVVVRVPRHVVGLGVDVGDQERHRVDPEARQPDLQPEADALGDLVAHRRVGEVEVGLVAVEVVEVPLAGLLVVGPDAVLLVREDDLVLGVRRGVGAPNVVVAVGVVLAAARLQEPRVLVGRVVDDQVRDDADAAVARRSHQLDEVAVGPQPGVDAERVGHVVAVVPAGGRVERHQPQAGDAELGQVVDLVGQPGEVPDPVAVGVVERLDVDAVDHCVLPPEVSGADVAGVGAESGHHRSVSRAPVDLTSPRQRGSGPRAGGRATSR